MAASQVEIILSCPTSSGLKRMIEVCEQHAKLHDALFNGSKSQTLVYNKKDALGVCYGWPQKLVGDWMWVWREIGDTLKDGGRLAPKQAIGPCRCHL